MSFDTFEKLPADKKELILSAGIREFSRRSYKDASTDTITKTCQISKGILFHYFGSKKMYYLYCLEKSMDRLTAPAEEAEGEDFYEILFAKMDSKMRLCLEYADEMHMVNMASRDASAEIAQAKAELLDRYIKSVRLQSAATVEKAVSALNLKDPDSKEITVQGLEIYISAILNRYLAQYQKTPDQFFENRESVRKDMKQYLDLMIEGICA